MKSFDEILADKRFTKEGQLADGIKGWVTNRGKVYRVIASNGGGWDHVSVSMRDRCPSWDEMCMIKDMFFYENECCVEYHPAKKNYVNVHPYCLHIWKPQDKEMPTPPKIFV